MMSEHDMSITSFTTKFSQKLFMIKWKNKIKIINTNLKQKWFMISETWQSTLNNLLQKWLYYSSIRKKKRILSESTEKLQRKEKNKMSNLKCWKSKKISSSRWIFKEIWWQVEALENRTQRNEKVSKSYIILMRMKSHLWFEIDSMMTCINKKLRKASQIRKIKEKTSSRTVIECIRNINKSINTNWAKLERRQLRRNIHWRRQKLIWDNFIRNKKTWD